MQDYYNSLTYALQSGPLFNLDEDSFYIKAMISRMFVCLITVDTCIDQYKESRKANIEDADIPEGIRKIVDFIFSQSLDNHNVAQLIGISVECNRLDLLERAICSSSDLSASLYSILHFLEEFHYPEDVRSRVLKLVQSIFVKSNDRYGVFICLLYENDLQGCMGVSLVFDIVSSLLIQCCQEDCEMAYQMAFSLYELQNIKLSQRIIESFPKDLLEDSQSPLSTVSAILSGKISKTLYSPSWSLM